MIEKLKDMRGGILLFLCLFVSINFYVNCINDLNNQENNRIAYYENN